MPNDVHHHKELTAEMNRNAMKTQWEQVAVFLSEFYMWKKQTDVDISTQWNCQSTIKNDSSFGALCSWSTYFSRILISIATFHGLVFKAILSNSHTNHVRISLLKTKANIQNSNRNLKVRHLHFPLLVPFPVKKKKKKKTHAVMHLFSTFLVIITFFTL